MELKGNTTLDKDFVINILNILIDKNKKSSAIMHIEGAIDNRLEILKKYGTNLSLKDLIDLLNIKNKEKDCLYQISSLFNITNSNVHKDILSFDSDITDLLDCLQKELETNLKSEYK